MSYRDPNATLSNADLQEIKQAIALIQQKLPFLITLSADDRKRLYKLGDKRLAFVQNSLTAAQSNPNILPASFDLPRFTNDYRLARPHRTADAVHPTERTGRRYTHGGGQRSHER